MSDGAQPLVSIIIPCFNPGIDLVESVESALAQTYPAVEIVIVDDGSTDPVTLDLLKNNDWPRTKIIRQANAGPASARNHAIREAHGVYILPLDADDKISPTYIEQAVRVLENEQDVGVVYCQATKFGAVNGAWHLPAYNIRELVIDNVIFVTSLFRRADWEQVGGFSESLKIGIEDYDFWVKIVGLGRDVRQLDDRLFHYRVGHESRTTGFNQDRALVVKTYADIFRSNIGFYSKHAEMFFEHRFGIYDELVRYRARYGRIEHYLSKNPRIESWVKRLYRLVLG